MEKSVAIDIRSLIFEEDGGGDLEADDHEGPLEQVLDEHGAVGLAELVFATR